MHELHYQNILVTPFLILPVPIPDEEKKLTEIFIFTRLCGAPKGFMKVFNFYLNINFLNVQDGRFNDIVWSHSSKK